MLIFHQANFQHGENLLDENSCERKLWEFRISVENFIQQEILPIENFVHRNLPPKKYVKLTASEWYTFNTRYSFHRKSILKTILLSKLKGTPRKSHA